MFACVCVSNVFLVACLAAHVCVSAFACVGMYMRVSAYACMSGCVSACSCLHGHACLVARLCVHVCQPGSVGRVFTDESGAIEYASLSVCH